MGGRGRKQEGAGGIGRERKEDGGSGRKREGAGGCFRQRDTMGWSLGNFFTLDHKFEGYLLNIGIAHQEVGGDSGREGERAGGGGRDWEGAGVRWREREGALGSRTQWDAALAIILHSITNFKASLKHWHCTS